MAGDSTWATYRVREARVWYVRTTHTFVRFQGTRYEGLGIASRNPGLVGKGCEIWYAIHPNTQLRLSTATNQ